jgi:hypothetical protein
MRLKETLFIRFYFKNQKYPIDLLRESLHTAIVCPIWYLRLLFLIGDYLVQNKDYNQSAYYMKLGIDYCAQNNIKYTHILFILSKGLVSCLLFSFKSFYSFSSLFFFRYIY